MQNLFKQMSMQLDDWKTALDQPVLKQQTHLLSFKESSEVRDTYSLNSRFQVLMMGLDDVRSVLQEKE